MKFWVTPDPPIVAAEVEPEVSRGATAAPRGFHVVPVALARLALASLRAWVACCAASTGLDPLVGTFN